MNLTLYQTIIIVMFVFTGALNTISVKFADLEESESIDGEIRLYNHPFLQSSQMFLGMFLNLVLYEILKYGFKKKSQGMYKEHILTKGSEDFNVFIFWIPALCDVLASTTVYIALNLTYASSFQMLKGAVIVFPSFLSYSCFGRVPNVQECLGIFLVVLGLAIVGLSDYLTKLGSFHKNDTLVILIGDIMVVTAQFLTATQVILEEKFVLALDVSPLQAVGWEGFFAFSTMAVLHVPLHFIYIGEPFVKNPSGTLEDLYDAYVQISNNWRILFASMVTVMSLAIYNFCGITVSKELTSTTREVLDSLNVVIVWIASLCIFGQKFQYIQLLGFMILLFGMGIYNDLCYTVIKKRSFQSEESESEDDEMTK